MPIESDKDKIAIQNHRAKVAAELANDQRTGVVCAICGKGIDPGRDLRAAWEEVTGFIVPRGGDGGANQVRLKHFTGRVIHDFCGRVAVAGPNAVQEPMW